MDTIDPGTHLAAPVPRIAEPSAAEPVRVARPALQGLLALAIYLGVFIIGFALPIGDVRKFLHHSDAVHGF